MKIKINIKYSLKLFEKYKSYSGRIFFRKKGEFITQINMIQ